MINKVKNSEPNMAQDIRLCNNAQLSSLCMVIHATHAYSTEFVVYYNTQESNQTYFKYDGRGYKI
jgi:hypothetical protein